jgi:DNA-binding GntR family transcriptional regulator
MTDIPMSLYQKADQKFHGSLIALSRNAIIKRMEVVGNIHIISYNRGLIRTPEETLPEHFGIVEAIEQRNSDLAEKRLRDHLHVSRDRMRAAFEAGHPIKATGS